MSWYSSISSPALLICQVWSLLSGSWNTTIFLFCSHHLFPLKCCVWIYCMLKMGYLISLIYDLSNAMVSCAIWEIMRPINCHVHSFHQRTLLVLASMLVIVWLFYYVGLFGLLDICAWFCSVNEYNIVDAMLFHSNIMWFQNVFVSYSFKEVSTSWSPILYYWILWCYHTPLRNNVRLFFEKAKNLLRGTECYGTVRSLIVCWDDLLDQYTFTYR